MSVDFINRVRYFHVRSIDDFDDDSNEKCHYSTFKNFPWLKNDKKLVSFFIISFREYTSNYN